MINLYILFSWQIGRFLQPLRQFFVAPILSSFLPKQYAELLFICFRMLLFSELEKARTATPPPCRTSWNRMLLAERNRSGSIDNNQLCALFFFSHSLFLSISLSSMTWCIKRPFCRSSLSFLSNSRKRGRFKSPPTSHAQMDNPRMKNPTPMVNHTSPETPRAN